MVGGDRFAVLRQRKPIGLAQVKRQEAGRTPPLRQHALVEWCDDEALEVQGAGFEQAMIWSPLKGSPKKATGDSDASER